jgi:hypothetical protein
MNPMKKKLLTCYGIRSVWYSLNTDTNPALLKSFLSESKSRKLEVTMHILHHKQEEPTVPYRTKLFHSLFQTNIGFNTNLDPAVTLHANADSDPDPGFDIKPQKTLLSLFSNFSNFFLKLKILSTAGKMF